MPRLDSSTPGAMSLTELQSRSLATALDGIGSAHALTGQSVPQLLASAQGSQLLGLDAWSGTSAAERTLCRPDAAGAGGAHIDQVINHILAPLG
jgi:hypothetical protein